MARAGFDLRRQLRTAAVGLSPDGRALEGSLLARRRVSGRLWPTARDCYVLKPKHSGIFDTTFDTLLETQRIRRVILTGMVGRIYVLFTANDA